MVKITLENINQTEYKQFLEQDHLPTVEEPIILENNKLKLINLTTSSLHFGEEQVWTFVIEALINLSTGIASGIISTFIYNKISALKQKHPSAKIKLNGRDITNKSESEIKEKVEEHYEIW